MFAPLRGATAVTMAARRPHQEAANLILRAAATRATGSESTQKKLGRARAMGWRIGFGFPLDKIVFEWNRNRNRNLFHSNLMCDSA